MKFQAVPVVLSIGGALFLSFNTQAALQFDLTRVFDGLDTPPHDDSAPWARMRFEDFEPGVVQLSLEASAGLTGIENIKQFYLNLDESLIPGGFSWSVLSATGAFDLPTVSIVQNGFKADGSGFYDGRVDFQSGGDITRTFTIGDSISLLLSHPDPSFNETSFLEWSHASGGNGPFRVAAHVQNTLNGGSAWITGQLGQPTPVPEPSGLALGGTLIVAGWLARHRNRRRDPRP